MENLKATDLMVGDWVKFYNESSNKEEYARVTSIQDGRFVQTSDSDVYYHEDIYKPISITKEILEKNGAYHTNNDRLHINNRIFEYNERWKMWNVGRMIDAYESPKFDIHLGIRYVHEFQHFLKLLGVYKDVEI